MDTYAILLLVFATIFLLVLLKLICKKCSASERDFAYISTSNQNLVESPPTVRFEKTSVYLPTITPYPRTPFGVNTSTGQQTATVDERQYPNPFCNSPPPPPGLGFTIANENQAAPYPINNLPYPPIGPGGSPETISRNEQYPGAPSALPPKPAPPSPGFAIKHVNQSTSYPLSISPFIEFGHQREVPQTTTSQPPVPPKSVCPYPTTITTVETKYRTPSGSNPGFIKISSSMSTSSNVPRRMETMSETPGASAPPANLSLQPEMGGPPYPTGDGAHSNFSRPPPPSYDEAMGESQSPIPKEFSDLNTNR